jgi:hypothetical protein
MPLFLLDYQRLQRGYLTSSSSLAMKTGLFRQRVNHYIQCHVNDELIIYFVVFFSPVELG